MPKDERASLQDYMNQLLRPLNYALNTIAGMPPHERPTDPKRAVALMLIGSDNPGCLIPSKELASLMGMVQPEPMTRDEIFSTLLTSGALNFSSIAATEVSMPSTPSTPKSPPMFGARVRCRLPDGAEIAPLDLERVDSDDAPSVPATSRSQSGKRSWQRLLKPALKKGKSDSNPWAQYEIHKQPTELCVRWDYNADRVSRTRATQAKE